MHYRTIENLPATYKEAAIRAYVFGMNRRKEEIGEYVGIVTQDNSSTILVYFERALIKSHVEKGLHSFTGPNAWVYTYTKAHWNDLDKTVTVHAAISKCSHLYCLDGNLVSHVEWKKRRPYFLLQKHRKDVLDYRDLMDKLRSGKPKILDAL